MSKSKIGVGIIILCIIVFFALKVRKNDAVAESAKDSLRIISYNVENLYDTDDDPDTMDDDLTPVGKLHWTTKRYNKKLNQISEVLFASGEDKMPTLVGLCEIENELVINDLVKSTELKKEGYKYVLTQSKDYRGVDVALLYQPNDFKLLEYKSYRPNLGSHAQPKYTRDILHVIGVINSGDTLDLFVCHFPARGGGVKKTQPNRIKVAQLLRSKVDSLNRVRATANVVIMGDFNDTPKDKSIRDVLKANKLDSKMASRKLYNLFAGSYVDSEIGTYKYQGEWFYYDQFIVSGSLLNKESKTQVKNNEAAVFDADFLLEKDRRDNSLQPFRTYRGWQYLGGYSDHLPIYLDLVW